MKWAGGKGRVLAQLAPLLPRDLEHMRHVEPFVGGGALFFASRPNRALLSDINESLMRTYIAVRDDVDDVISRLRSLSRRHTSEPCYYDVRRLFNTERSTWSDAQVAAHFIYLNRTCFNGLYRVNRRGEFNVPVGSYVRPVILEDAEGLRAASARLAGVELGCASFEAVLEHVTGTDFVYLDPPYAPTTKTSSFRAYSEHGFGPEDQVRVRDVFTELTRRGPLCQRSCRLSRAA